MVQVLLPKISEIYLNDMPEKSGLIYDCKKDDLTVKKQALKSIQIFRKLNSISYEAIAVCRDKKSGVKKYILRTRTMNE